MKPGNQIRASLFSLLVLAAAMVAGSFAPWDAQAGAPLPVAKPQALLPSGLPSNPQDWICPESSPVTQQDIDAWCNSHEEKDLGEPLPPELRNPPPISDFENYQRYSERLEKFLVLNLTDPLSPPEYARRGWVSDEHWRLSGPSVIPPKNNPTDVDFFHNYGPHFPLKIYYSPEVVKWLCGGRKGEIPDGAMMVKAMNLFGGIKIGPLEIGAPNIKIAEDGCMDVTSKFVLPILWTPMIKSSRSSNDGWVWTIQQPVINPRPPQAPPPLFDLSAFTQPPDPAKGDDPAWYPTGSLLEKGGTFDKDGHLIDLKIPDVVMLNPLAGLSYCMSCHSTARRQSTFASMDNILGRELRYKAFETAPRAYTDAHCGQFLALSQAAFHTFAGLPEFLQSARHGELQRGLAVANAGGIIRSAGRRRTRRSGTIYHRGTVQRLS